MITQFIITKNSKNTCEIIIIILKQNTKINKLSTGGMNSSMEKSQYHATTHIHTYSRLIQGAE